MMLKLGLVEEREREEADLVARKPEARGLLDELGRVYDRFEAIAPRSDALERLRGTHHGSALLATAHALYDAAIQRSKPEEDRDPYLRDASIAATAAKLAKRLEDAHAPLEAALVFDACRGSNWRHLYPVEDPIDEDEVHDRIIDRVAWNVDRHDLRPDVVGRPTATVVPSETRNRDAIALPMNFASVNGIHRGGVETLEAAKKLVDSSPLRRLDAAAVAEILRNPYDCSHAILKHPLTGITEAAYGTYQADRDETAALAAKRDVLVAKLLRLADDVAVDAPGGTEPLPDCTGALRISYGTVDGYTPTDAVRHDPFTCLKGLLDDYADAVANADDDALRTSTPPQRLLDTLADDPTAQTTPVNVLYSTDTLAGTAGAPVLDAKGRLVAVNVDTQKHGLINEYKYSPEYSRSVGVDVRYLLWLVGAYDGATALAKEILRA